YLRALGFTALFYIYTSSFAGSIIELPAPRTYTSVAPQLLDGSLTLVRISTVYLDDVVEKPLLAGPNNVEVYDDFE
ncbi:hypothetical protein PENTCL1PPCAC_29988, partial [Pristionchus entomophagus]